MGQLNFQTELLPVLLVALVTWGGVFCYMWRLEKLVHEVEGKVADAALGHAATDGGTSARVQ